MTEVVTAKQIADDLLNGLKTPNRVLEDAKGEGFPPALRKISRKPLVWDKEAVIHFYYGNGESA